MVLAIEDALLVSTTSQPGAAWSRGPGTRVHLGGGHVFGQASIRRLTRNLGLMIQGLLSNKSPTGPTFHGPRKNLRILIARSHFHLGVR